MFAGSANTRDRGNPATQPKKIEEGNQARRLFGEKRRRGGGGGGEGKVFDEDADIGEEMQR